MDRQRFNLKLEEFLSNARNVLGPRYFEALDDIPFDRSPGQLTFGQVHKILSRLNVTLDSVLENSIDFEALSGQFMGKGLLPAKYLNKLPLSSRFTGVYMVNFISNSFGEESAKFTMQHFQLKPDDFEDTNLKNNILLSIDLTGHILKYYGPETVESMGANSASLLSSTAAGRLLAMNTNVVSLYEHFFEEVAPALVEKNYHWEIQSTSSDEIYISGRPYKEVEEAFGKKALATEGMELLRKGFLTALPGLTGATITMAHQVESLRSGQGRDLYRIGFQSRYFQ